MGGDRKTTLGKAQSPPPPPPPNEKKNTHVAGGDWDVTRKGQLQQTTIRG